MSEFDDNKLLFDSDKINNLLQSEEGTLWLKVKSISRKELLDGFCRFTGITGASGRVADKFREVYDALLPDVEDGHRKLNEYIKLSARVYSRSEEESIVSELHQLRYFAWGGGYSNALDKFLVDKYVKVHSSYKGISQKLSGEISQVVSGYVLCSWYNHWSAMLIENIFKQHEKVLPAIGNVKRIDFFIEGVPFDLKTTYLPDNFVDAQRKSSGLRGECAQLKSVARAHEIPFDKNGKNRDVLYEISEKIKTGGNRESKRCLNDLREFRIKIVRECMKNPANLVRNLYEQQGEMRFDASNRLFVVLIDADNFSDSWKLKRNPDMLRKSINAHLDKFSASKLPPKVVFSHPSRSGEFSAIGDVVFVVANAPGVFRHSG